VRERETERDASTERVTDDIGALEVARIHESSQVVDHGRCHVAVPTRRLVGESMAAQVEGERVPTGGGERREREAKRVRTRAPAME
jgi:hypothetical protein